MRVFGGKTHGEITWPQPHRVNASSNAFSVKPRRFFPERLKTTARGQLAIFRIVPFVDMDFRPLIALLAHRTPTLSASKSFLLGFRKQARRLSCHHLSSGASNLEATLRLTTIRSHSVTLLTWHLEASMLGA